MHVCSKQSADVRVSKIFHRVDFLIRFLLRLIRVNVPWSLYNKGPLKVDIRFWIRLVNIYRRQAVGGDLFLPKLGQLMI